MSFLRLLISIHNISSPQEWCCLKRSRSLTRFHAYPGCHLSLARDALLKLLDGANCRYGISAKQACKFLGRPAYAAGSGRHFTNIKSGSAPCSTHVVGTTCL